MKNKFYSTILALIFGLGLLASTVTPPVYAEIPDHVAMRVLVGEAADQGIKGMVCVGEVLRRRGSIKGFYGYNSKSIKTAPPSVWKIAESAWKQSKYTNYTKGADHFEIVGRSPYWVKNCVKVYEYKGHTFYKYQRGPMRAKKANGA